jgi:UDP-N-acetylmuramoylalanine--D-glutamate ligase
MIRRQDRIGVFDSGVGGLEMLYQLRRLLPDENIYYFADTVNLPYGERSPEEITRFLTDIIDGMLLRRVKLLVIACNTASAVWLSLDFSHPLRVRLREAGVDVVPMTTTESVSELLSLAPAHVAVVGTRLTVNSGIYQSLIRELLPSAEITAIAAPRWVTRVENPDADPQAEQRLRMQAVESALEPLLNDPPQALVLACTHFPRLQNEIRAVLGPDVVIVNPAPALAHFVRNYLSVRDLRARERLAAASNAVLFTNGDPAAIYAQLSQMNVPGDLEVRNVDIRSDLSGKIVDVVGYGATGKSLIRYLSTQPIAALRLRDRNPDSAAKLAVDFPGADIATLSGNGYLDGLTEADVVFRSPGVAANLTPFVDARRKGVPIMSDIDLFLKHAPGHKVAISGTNGKTTTTILTQRFFAAQLGEQKSHLVGNIGRPVLDDLAQIGRDHVCAIELSSFQLEELNALPVQAAILLNITPDHLDRHGDMAGYIKAKGRIFTLLDENAYAIYSIDSEPIVNQLLPMGCRAKMIPISTQRKLEMGAFRDGDDLVWRRPDGVEWRMGGYWPTRRFVGDHNLENLLASSMAAWLMGVPLEIIAEVVRDFAGVRYRIERFWRLNGVDYFDDSKGTNPDATIKALECLPGPIVLVAGGVNKGTALDEVAAACANKVRHALLFGPIASEFAAALGALPQAIVCETVSDLESAACCAHELAKPGEHVLFSPACASPPGEKYYQRGDRFKKTVRALGENEALDLGSVLDDPLADHSH